VDLGEAVGDAVLPADLVEQHLHRHTRLVEPAGEHLGVVGQHFLGHPVGAHRVHERQAHRPGGRPHDRRGEDAEPGMVIDPGNDLHLGAVNQECAGGHIELPQLHRGAAFPAPVVLAAAPPRLRLDQPVADQGAVDAGAGHLVAAAAHLEYQPAWTPLRVPAAKLADQLLGLGRDAPGMVMDLVAAVLQPRDPFLPVAHQPRVHALAADPIPFGDLGHRNPGADFQHGAVSLLGHTQLPQHERECQASSEAKVSSIKRDSTTPVVRCGENFPYVFKGARSAPYRDWPPSMRKRRAMAALSVKRRCVRPHLAGHRGTVTRRASAAFLWPFGPRRRRRALTPRGRPYGLRAATSAVVRGGAKRGHPSGARILKPCVLAVKSARCARVAARSLRASGPLRRRDSGAPVGGMGKDWSTPLTASWQLNRIVAIIKPCLTRRLLPRTGMHSVSNSKRPWVLYAIGRCWVFRQPGSSLPRT
jgi:hypothetical protein